MIEILIDKLTNCLILRSTNERRDTWYTKMSKRLTMQDIRDMHEAGWNKNFDWKSVQEEGYTIVELFADEDDRVQGLIAYKHIHSDKYTFVPLVEAAPWNCGHEGEYIGVGAHLFAIACKESWDNGNEGYVMFEAKTDLIEHYKEKLSAIVIDWRIPVKMVLDTKAASILIEKYLLRKER